MESSYSNHSMQNYAECMNHAVYMISIITSDLRTEHV